MLSVVAASGNRCSLGIREVGAIVWKTFDLLVLKEDNDRRRRKPSTIAALLHDAAREAGMRPDRMITVLDERRRCTPRSAWPNRTTWWWSAPTRSRRCANEVVNHPGCECL